MKDVCRVCAGKGVISMYYTKKEKWHPESKPGVYYDTIKTYFNDEWCKACEGRGWAVYPELNAVE